MRSTILASFFTVCLAAPAPAQSKGAALPGTLPLEEIRAFLADARNHESFVPQAPLGLPEDLWAFVPADNPLTPAKAELGRQLYFDPRLSRDSTVSCATCHDPTKGWTDQAPVSTGIGGQKGDRSAPTVINRFFGKIQFWDGRAASLEEQALGPIENPIEMGSKLEDVVKRLEGIEGYRLQFTKIFGGVSAQAIAAAIASFERTVLSGGAPEDYYARALPFLLNPIADDDPDREFVEKQRRILDEWKAHAMSEAALRGRELFFGKANCSLCHVGNNFADEAFFNIGVGFGEGGNRDPGREKVTKNEKERGAFKTPTLRQLTETAPYMHDGSEATLEDVVEYYDRGGTPNPWLDARIQPLKLTKEEKADLVAYLREAFRGSVTKVAPPRLP
jgi:cytochrome c peroxidase